MTVGGAISLGGLIQHRRDTALVGQYRFSRMLGKLQASTEVRLWRVRLWGFNNVQLAVSLELRFCHAASVLCRWAKHLDSGRPENLV